MTKHTRLLYRGALLISNLERAKYLATVRKIIPILKDVPDDTIIFSVEKILGKVGAISEEHRSRVS